MVADTKDLYVGLQMQNVLMCSEKYCKISPCLWQHRKVEPLLDKYNNFVNFDKITESFERKSETTKNTNTAVNKDREIVFP